jgi:4-amino-4-deoxy-L-arabinose transferase-like glycosyltransferase
MSASAQQVLTAGFIVTTCVLLAALISLLWLRRSDNRIELITLLALFGFAALCAFVYYFFTLSVLLLIPLLLLTPGTLIATRQEMARAVPLAQPEPQENGQQENGQTVQHPVS